MNFKRQILRLQRNFFAYGGFSYGTDFLFLAKVKISQKSKVWEPEQKLTLFCIMMQR